MKAMISVDAGICGFKTQIQADGDGEQNVTFRIASGCQNIRAFGEALAAKGPVVGYAVIGEGFEGIVLTCANSNVVEIRKRLDSHSLGIPHQKIVQKNGAPYLLRW